MIKYGSRSRSSRRKQILATNGLHQSRSAKQLDIGIQNLKNKIQTSIQEMGSRNKSKKSSSPVSIDAEACFISNKLYEDAIKRLEAQKHQERKQSRSAKKNKANPVTENSNKYLMKRFIEDYNQAIRKLKIKQSKLNFQKAEELLRELGFITKPKTN